MTTPLRDIPPLDGPLRPNGQLERCWEVANRLHEPDDVAADAAGRLYVSAGRQVLRFEPNRPRPQAFADLPGTAGALCMLPDGGLWVAVAGSGVVRLSAQGQRVRCIETADDRPIRCATALAAAADGTLYIAEGSAEHGPADWVRDLMGKGASGRLIRVAPDADRGEVLQDGLAWPFGLGLSPDGRGLIFTESWRHALRVLDLAGHEAVRTVQDNLPGYPARIAPASDGGWWLSVFALRNRLVEFVLREDGYRRAMMAAVAPEHWVAPSLRSTAVDPYPWLSPSYATAEDYYETLQAGRIRSFGALKPWAPARSYGLVIKLDSEFDPVASMHSRVNDHRHGITGVCEAGSALFAVSKGYGMLLRTSTTVALERATEQVKKKKIVREELKKYGKGRPQFTVPETPFLRVKDATKRYGGVAAIQAMNFDLRAGEVHALLGENGAGKSTLCKALAGAVQLTEGGIEIDGKALGSFASSAQALDAGIAMVYQETSLVASMTVAQNIELGREKGFNRLRRFNIHAQQFLAGMGFSGIDAKASVGSLGAAHKQMVEIARAVYHQARVIIFDEPTATLTPAETRAFFELIENLRGQGVAIVFISHAIEESLQIADRITIMRDGRHVITGPAKDFSRDTVVRHMVGRDDVSGALDLIGRREQRATRKKRKVITVENVCVSPVLRNITFSLYEGEITGIAGLVGSGRTEVAKVIAGALKRDVVGGGTITLDGKPVRYRTPSQAIADGIVYVTEDRKVNGFFETMAIDENIHMGWLASRAGRRMTVSRSECEAIGTEWIARLSIRALDRATRVNRLSGGNQQKVVIAKSAVQKPRVIIFDEPTRGVDVGAIADVHAYIRSLRQEGVVVVVISSYLPEVMAISDRVLVARQGQIVAEFSAADATEDKLMHAAMH